MQEKSGSKAEELQRKLDEAAAGAQPQELLEAQIQKLVRICVVSAVPHSPAQKEDVTKLKSENSQSDAAVQLKACDSEYAQLQVDVSAAK